MNSKRKGSGGERELLEILRGYGIKAERNDQRFEGGKGNPDILALINGHEIHVEAKRSENIRLTEWISQAEYDCSVTKQRIPVVIFRKSRKPWYCTIRFTDLMKLLNILKEDDPG